MCHPCLEISQGRSSSFSDADADPCAASSVSHGVSDALHASVIDDPGGIGLSSFCRALDVVAGRAGVPLLWRTVCRISFKSQAPLMIR